MTTPHDNNTKDIKQNTHINNSNNMKLKAADHDTMVKCSNDVIVARLSYGSQ